MTTPDTPDTPTIRRQLALLADFLRTEATRPKADRTRLDAAGQEVAVLREQLRGKTLITLPAPDETHPDRWWCQHGQVDAGELDGNPAVRYHEQFYAPDVARELGLALLAAAALADCPAPDREMADHRPHAAP